MDNIRFSPVALVPEPSTGALLGVGGLALAWAGRRRKQLNDRSIRCGPPRAVALPNTPDLSYPVDVRRDLLVIYNSNFTDDLTIPFVRMRRAL